MNTHFTPESWSDPSTDFSDYSRKLADFVARMDWSSGAELAHDLADCIQSRRHVFICGNGGSAANASHLANDFSFAVARKPGAALRATSLTANAALLTCLANDTGYELIFDLQLAELANPGDILIVLSGSGQSANILRALERAATIGMRSYAVVGFSGGKAALLADKVIHFPVDDMQIAEDMQLILGHMVTQWLWRNQSQAIAQADAKFIFRQG